MRSIAAISGTSRPNNYTSRALAVVVDKLREQGADVTVLDARELTLNFPGHPATEDAKRVADIVRSAHGVVLATPEYHGTFASMTKLILENMGFPSALQDKPMTLLGIAQGRIGAIKSLEHLRSACAHMGAIVVPATVSVAGIQNAFAKDGTLSDAGVRAALEGTATSLLQFLQTYVCPKYVLEAMVRDESDKASAPWTASL